MYIFFGLLCHDGFRILLLFLLFNFNLQQFFVNTEMTKTKPIMIDQINLKTLTIMTKYLVHTGPDHLEVNFS